MVECKQGRGDCAWKHHPMMCRKSCYNAYAAALVKRWTDEDAEREERGVYLGCPVCKQEVRFRCHHDGRDYASVELSI